MLSERLEDRQRMSIATPFQGSLFANDFFRDSIARLDDWSELDAAALDAFEASVRDVFDGFPIAGSPNESQTEDDLIWPVLEQLGWTASLRQQNLSAHGREDVPDGLLFRDAAAKARANGFTEEWKRYEFGLAVVESKRWGRPLDRRSGRRGEETAPSTQMLRYLRRVDDLTTGKLRWGILTNGARWRLYYQGARSVSEQFFEIDLVALLDLPGYDDGLLALTEADRRRWLKVFVLVFRREAFLAGTADPRTFHQRAIEEGRYYEKRVAANLAALVFDQVFPGFASAIAAAAPGAPLSEVREATLILLYRLLFILYAEDRALLPVRNTRYDDYALREKVRGDVGRRKDRDDVFSASAAPYWAAIDDLCRAIDQGDASIGLPPYNGGLFDRDRTPLLGRIRLGDEVMAKTIDALSFEQTPVGRRCGTARRPAYRPAHGSQALRLWRRQEPHGRRIGQGRALAAHLHGGRTVELPGSSSPLRRQPVWFMGTHGHRQGDRAGWIALFGRSGKTGHAGRGSHADHRGTDRRRDRGDDGAIECFPFPGPCLRLAEHS